MTRQHGIEADTYEKLILDSGAIYKNFVDFTNLGELIGATRGGAVFKRTPEYKELKYEGVPGQVAGQKQLTNVKVSLDVSIVAFDIYNLMEAIPNSTSQTAPLSSSYTEITEEIWDAEAVHELSNIAIVAQLAGVGDPVVIVLDNPICESDFSLGFKDKTEAVSKWTFSAFYDEAVGFDSPPWRIYWPVVHVPVIVKTLVAPALINTRWINDLFVFGGSIYGCTYARQPGNPSSGEVQVFTGSAWSQVAPIIESNTNRLYRFIQYDNGSGDKLFVCSGFGSTAPPVADRAALLWVDIPNSLLKYAAKVGAITGFPSENTAAVIHSSQLYGLLRGNTVLTIWDETLPNGSWGVEETPYQVGQVYGSTPAAIVFSGTLYAGTAAGGTDPGGRLIEFVETPTKQWATAVNAHANLVEIQDLIEFNSKVYAIGTGATATNTYLMEWDGVGSTWSQVAVKAGGGQGRRLVIIRGELYVIATANVLRWDGVSAFVVIATATGNENYVSAAVLNEDIYIGTGDDRVEPITGSDGGKLYKIDLDLAP